MASSRLFPLLSAKKSRIYANGTNYYVQFKKDYSGSSEYFARMADASFILGSSDDDYINGTSGNEVIYSEEGNDTVHANNGNDTIFSYAVFGNLVGV